MHLDIITGILDQVAQANPNRCQSSLDGRVTKLIEELGEIAEAFLNVTSVTNEKNKTWADVREEAADVLIIAADIALTPLDGQTNAQLATYVQTSLHRINLGFHQIIWRISRLNASFGQHYHDAASGRQYSAEMVRYAFALNRLVAKPTQLSAEVRRKIKKWKRKLVQD